MRINLLICGSFLLATSMLANASPILTVGQPGNSQLASPSGPSVTLGNLINFDNLTPNSTFNSSTFVAQGVTSISSPNGLLVLPFSTQSGPNELFDNGANGTANTTITLARGTSVFGIGIADSDSVSITFQPLAMNGSALGSAFTVNLATTESTVNTGNGYYILSDTTPDIFGLQILQTVSNPNFSGLAIDDIQTTPEPASFLLLAFGAVMIMFGSLRLRKRA